jgi:putative spermidine/putrescine transport system substrate-binding protein
MKALRVTLAIAATLSAVVAGCGGDDGGGSGSGSGSAGKVTKAPEVPMAKSVGKGEGKVNLIAWAGYVEDGSSDPAVDWVSDFEKDTGCQVDVKIGNTSDEMVTLMRTGQYDGVSASGDATLRLIAAGDVAPVNTELIPNYADVFDALKDRDFNSVDGQMYGVPQGRGANLLMWNTDEVKPAPKSWDAVFDPAKMADHEGKITGYDNPIYIADAAVYLKAHNPDLGIENPYELDEKQFTAAVDLLKEQRKFIGEYWSDYAKEQAAFAQGDLHLGTTWQFIANLLTGDKNPTPVKTMLPSEGATGWSDTWMIASEAKHPNCMYKWMDHIISPKANAGVAEWFGEAPANAKACDLVAKGFCEQYHADDEEFFDKIAFWTTPTAQCGDDRGAVCKDYSAWVNAWTEIKG